MNLTLDPGKLKRYKDIALLILKYGDKELLNNDPLNETIEENLKQTDKEVKEKSENFAKDLEGLGPTFIKLGQLLSTRPDFLPQPYITALSRLQDNVEPFTFEQVEAIVETELGVRLSKGFQQFDQKPLAAASLGQVHYAVLRNGAPVAVKIQRPDIREIILKDLQALEEIAGSLDKYTNAGRKFAFENILHEFRKALLQELDYRLEAQNLKLLNKNLYNYNSIIIPLPVDDYCTSRVLTMDYVKGTKITSLSPLAKLEIDGNRLAGDLFRAYLDQVLVDGFFHADPHPGNVFLSDDKRIALIDLGMVARLDPEFREGLLKLLIYVSEGRGRDAAQTSLDIGIKLENNNAEKFKREVSEFVTHAQGATIESLKMGQIVVELTRIASENGIRLPSELTMLGKTLLNLDEIGRTLAPDFDPNAAIREHTQSIIQKHLFQNITPGNFFSSLLDVKEFLQKLPSRLNSLLDAFTNKEFEIKIKSQDERKLMFNLQKIANRITVGLILAALIIGAALMMRVSTRFTIMGYPGLPILMFLTAAITGLVLVITIFLQDEWGTRKDKKS